MENKINKSLEIIKICLSKAKMPVIWSSFGKDSLVLIHLIRQINKNIPCLFQREYINPKAYEHSQNIIKNWELKVYDFPPMDTALQKHIYENGDIEWEIQNYYSIGRNNNFTIPTGIVDNANSKICALQDIYIKPFAFVNYIWDVTFIGHKDADTDAFYNDMTLNNYVYKHDLQTFVFPLKDWSDQDVWNYIDQNKIDYNAKRYVREGKSWRGQYKDVSYNPDYFECCLECMKPDYKDLVYCPKKKIYIKNISHLIKKGLPPDTEYMKGNK